MSLDVVQLRAMVKEVTKKAEFRHEIAPGVFAIMPDEAAPKYQTRLSLDKSRSALDRAHAAEKDLGKTDTAQKQYSALGALAGMGTGLGAGGAASLLLPKHRKALMLGGGALGTLTGAGLGGALAAKRYGSSREAKQRMGEAVQDLEAANLETERHMAGIPKAAGIGEDLPWYTTAAGATGGVLAAQKFLPKKYKGIGQIGGALLGTGLGLEGGKAIGKRLEKPATPTMPKTAEGEVLDNLPETGNQDPEDESPLPPPPPEDMSKKRKPKPKPEHPALTLGKSLTGLGLGMGAGYAGMRGVDYGLKKVTGKGIPTSKLTWAIPATTAALGMAYPYMHQATVDKMRKSHLERQEAKRGG